jgi:hypothetical protein
MGEIFPPGFGQQEGQLRAGGTESSGSHHAIAQEYPCYLDAFIK